MLSALATARAGQYEQLKWSYRGTSYKLDGCCRNKDTGGMRSQIQNADMPMACEGVSAWKWRECEAKCKAVCDADPQ